jgi:septin family protein
MIDLYKGDCFQFQHSLWVKDLLKHPITKEVIVMKSSAVGKTTFFPELFKKKCTEDTAVDKGLFDE